MNSISKIPMTREIMRENGLRTQAHKHLAVLRYLSLKSEENHSHIELC